MDKYQVLEELPPGAFGTVFVVEDSLGERSVLKKVECVDEGEANRALKEAMTLLTLQHPNICAYKEGFIVWDTKTSSVFLCLVMNYMGNEDLAGLIRGKRENQEAIDETVVQMLLGQAVDALVHIHKRNIIHRNLKPSNILLRDEMSFVIGDFCVETLMNDEMKLNIRIDEECKSWMSPEALRFSFSGKSDIWSLGCILLEMISCPVLNDTEMAALLSDLRHDPSVLKKALKTMEDSSQYDSGLSQVLLKMLQVNPEERASARELADLPYVKDCLALCGSPLSGQKKDLPLGAEDELQECGIEGTLDFMQVYEEYEDAQILALLHLSTLTGEETAFCLRTDIVQIVAQTMRLYSGSMDVQLEGFRVLKDLTGQVLEEGLEDDILTSEELISALLEAIRTFPSSVELLTMACQLLMMVSGSEAAAEMLARAGVVSDVLQILSCFPENRDVCLSCSGALWSLAASESSRQSLSSGCAINILCNVLRTHLEDGEVAESVCCALWILSLQGSCSGFLSSIECFAGDQHEEVTLVLLQALKKHPERPILVKNACLALASLFRTSELAAFTFLVPTADFSGTGLIKDCYQIHSEDPEVLENITLLFSELVQYDDALPELRSRDVAQMLKEIKIKFASTEEIVKLAEKALLRLQQKE
ncbi:serine/threonine kinase-like domain-containing protein STKLD1 [Pleurodeles waltl]|uniref:serine/threonine kinase-like domain-containing protein STKLD1 n=1 Tax=Pleurodeles waltl TaxID=8319 RepID=UPI003709A65E